MRLRNSILFARRLGAKTVWVFFLLPFDISYLLFHSIFFLKTARHSIFFFEELFHSIARSSTAREREMPTARFQFSLVIWMTVALLCAMLHAPAAALGPPIYVGTFTGTTSADYIVRTAISPVFDAFDAVFANVNEHGGINGRPLELIKCETAMNGTKVAACARNFSEQCLEVS
jgi:hypothetical protein